MTRCVCSYRQVGRKEFQQQGSYRRSFLFIEALEYRNFGLFHTEKNSCCICINSGKRTYRVLFILQYVYVLGVIDFDAFQVFSCLNCSPTCFPVCWLVCHVSAYSLWFAR